MSVIEDSDGHELIIDESSTYRQVMAISADGTASTQKFEHQMSRSINCKVIVDGEVVQWSHSN